MCIYSVVTLEEYLKCMNIFYFQPGNDVSQRINRARHFMRAASNSLNRSEVQ